MIHYHCADITPRSELEALCPNNYCASFAYCSDNDAAWLLRRAQSIMWDNGAWTLHSSGKPVDWKRLYAWLDDGNKLRHPHWAVVPDVIGGSVYEQRALEQQWPFPRELSGPVYHIGEPLDRLRELVEGWPRIAIGGCVGSYEPGTAAWERSIDAIWTVIEASGAKPWVHMMRAHSEASLGRWPFASADSSAFARHHKEQGEYKTAMLHRINSTNPDPAPCPHLELFT